MGHDWGGHGNANLLDQVKTALAYLTRMGVKGVDCSPSSLDRMASWGKGPVVRPETLETICRDIAHCRGCGLETAGSAKPPEQGPLHPRFIIVVHWPNTETALPFDGPAGELLLKIVQAMELAPEDIYVLNTVKCRPQGELSPFSRETGMCVGFLKRQLALLKPEVVCVMGAFAAQALLQTKTPLSDLRGRFHDYEDMSVMPTFHPDALLMDPSKKRAVWEDVKQIKHRLNL